MRDELSASEWLNSEGIKLRNHSIGNHKTTCPHCSHTRKNKKDPCLSVTIGVGDDVVCHCHHCEWSAGTGTKSNRDYKPTEYAKPKPPEVPQQPDTLMEYFKGRGISEVTVKQMGIHKTTNWFPQTDGREDCIAFPYEWDGELRNVKYRSAGKHFRQEKNPQPVFYNADNIIEDEDLIIVEGEIDVLSYIEAGLSNVVSLPNGAPSGPEKSDKRYQPLVTHAEKLEKVKRIYIATDTDDAGWRLANELSRRLGRDRCFRVKFGKHKDVNDQLQEDGVDAVVNGFMDAIPWPVAGLNTVDDYWSEVIDLREGRGPMPVGTGFDGFDRCFKVIPGQFVVITGIPNHGKSRWMDQVAVQMAQNHFWNWGVFSPETGEAQHITDLLEIIIGLPFFDGHTRRMTDKEMTDAKKWLGKHFTFIVSKDHTPSIDWILEKAKALVLRNGINGLIIDPYNEIEAGRPKNMTETEFISQLISKCKKFARMHEVAIFMVVHPTKLYPAKPGEVTPPPGLYNLSGSAHWNNKSDAGLVVYRDFEEKKTTVYSRKIRRDPVCGTPGELSFIFDGSTRKFEELI